MRFPQHGSFSLCISSNIIEVYATGAWDIGITNELLEEIPPLIESLNGQPWAALIDTRRWVLSTPEAQSLLAQGIRKLIDTGLQRSAYVLDTNMIKRVQIERTHPMLKEHDHTVNYNREYFPTYFAALHWLKSQGFEP
jgi:hypothetical protein